MSARAAQALAFVLFVALLAGGCGGSDGHQEPTTSPPVAGGQAVPPEHRGFNPGRSPGADPEAGGSTSAGKKGSPGDATGKQATASHDRVGKATEQILRLISPEGPGKSGSRKGRDAVERLIAQARKEGVRVIEHGGGSEGGGIRQILRQLHAKHP